MNFKDNIDSKVIINRKLIIELRFNPVASVLDKKGTIADAISAAKIFKPDNFWEISNNVVRFQSSENKNNTQFIATVEYNKITFVGVKIDSIDSFFSLFTKFYKTIKDNIPNWTITRIGCRVLGAYKSQNTDFSILLSNFTKLFPNQFIVEPYQTKDLLFRMDYASGMYQIAPLKDDDDFYKREFPTEIINGGVGIMLDTDNYTLKIDDVDIDSIENIKTIFIASLAVEKSLYENLKDM